MRTSDLVAGVRHAWALDRAEILWFAAYQVLAASLLVILGAPIGWPVVVLCASVVPLITRGVQRGRQYADHRLFVDWLTTRDAADL